VDSFVSRRGGSATAVWGLALDNVLHTAPVFVLIGLFVGLAAGAAGVWMKVRDFSK